MSRASGFKPLRPGKIHMRCPKCGRKQSNMDRSPEYDHPTAFLMEMLCEKCDAGCKEVAPEWYDKRGRHLDSFAYFDRLAHGSRAPREAGKP